MQTDAEYYKNLTTEKPLVVELSQKEQIAVLKAYDYGYSSLSIEQKKDIDAVFSKLKDGIWP